MQAMILAAGLGTRMRPLTDHTPKPLLRVAGKTLLEQQITRLAAAGFDSVVINISYLADQIQTFIESHTWPLSIQLSFEEQPLETAGGIQHAFARGLLSREQPVLLVNGDIWCDYDLKRLPSLTAGQQAHLILVPNPEHHPDGDFLLGADGTVSNRTGTTAAQQSNTIDPNAQQSGNGQTLTFSGISILAPSLIPPSLLQKTEPLPLGPLLRAAATNGKVRGERFNGYWLDVGTPKRLRQLERHLQQRI